MQHQPFVHPITPRKTDPVPTSSTAPTPQSNFHTDVPAPVEPCSTAPGLHSGRSPEALPPKETASTAGSLSLFIENFDRLEPTGLGVAIELAQITKRALSRTVR